MCKFIGKSNEWILCKLSKSEILRLYSIVHVTMETTETSHFTCWSKSFISIFSLAKFQLVSCNLSLDIIWQRTYTQKLPKLCSATLKTKKKKNSFNCHYIFSCTLVRWFIRFCTVARSDSNHTGGFHHATRRLVRGWTMEDFSTLRPLCSWNDCSKQILLDLVSHSELARRF